MKWLLLLLLVLPCVFGATIEGSVYDFGLENVANAIVRINTTPEQMKVASDGTYSFEVGYGTYHLTAEAKELLSEENITVRDEGVYILDIIMLPILDESLLEELPVVDVEASENFFEERPAFAWVLWLIVFLFIIALVIAFAKKDKKTEVVDEQLQKVLTFINKEGGRTTQKDIRKAFPVSEAKISLILHDLEEKGLIKRMKKGRGNIVIRQ